MRITRARIEEILENLEREYGFDSQNGWDQVRGDLKPPPLGSIDLPRAIAYGQYMALSDLLE